MSGICLKRSASAFLIAVLPRRVRPTGSGPRARQNVASSAKQSTMCSTSRLLNAAEIARISSIVTIPTPSFPPSMPRGSYTVSSRRRSGSTSTVDTGLRRHDKRAGLAGRAGLPQNIAGAVVVDPAAEHEQMVGEPVQVFDRLGVDLLGGGQRADQALGPPRHSAREMKVSRGGAATGQDERVERAQ